jgi:hypothetical protein
MTSKKGVLYGCKCESNYKEHIEEFSDMAYDLFTIFPKKQYDGTIERPDVVKVAGFWFTITELRAKKTTVMKFYELDAPSLGLEGKIACECELQKK